MFGCLIWFLFKQPKECNVEVPGKGSYNIFNSFHLFELKFKFKILPNRVESIHGQGGKDIIDSRIMEYTVSYMTPKI